MEVRNILVGSIYKKRSNGFLYELESISSSFYCWIKLVQLGKEAKCQILTTPKLLLDENSYILIKKGPEPALGKAHKHLASPHACTL